LRKTGSLARRLFNSVALLLLTFSCTKEFIKPGVSDAPIPYRIEHAYTIELATPQFTPQRITSDISGKLFVTGNNRRLIVVDGRENVEEIILEAIYPCEIIDINSDGFDIFLLDRLSEKIWTVKQKTLLEKGFALEDQPHLLAISERNYMAIAFRDRKELSVFSRKDKLFTGIHLESPLREDDAVDLLFAENIIYVAHTKHGQISVLPLFNPAQKYQVPVRGPSSLAMDRQGYLFVACAEGIGYLRQDEMVLLHSMKTHQVEITIQSDSLYVLEPSQGIINVYSILYAAPGADAP
jgi:hypothetical protein